MQLSPSKLSQRLMRLSPNKLSQRSSPMMMMVRIPVIDQGTDDMAHLLFSHSNFKNSWKWWRFNWNWRRVSRSPTRFAEANGSCYCCEINCKWEFEAESSEKRNGIHTYHHHQHHTTLTPFIFTLEKKQIYDKMTDSVIDFKAGERVLHYSSKTRSKKVKSWQGPFKIVRSQQEQYFWFRKWRN